jgi:hypothetical protein
MESKHTPGPWESTIVHGESRSIKCVMADGPTQVCVLTEGTMEDARLIAAAPELLAACKSVLFDLQTLTSHDFQHGGDAKCRLLLKSAIAKAFLED